MRELSDEEMGLLKSQTCPFCDGHEFYEGPEGGLSKNWYCANPACGAGFNIRGFGALGGELIREPGPVESGEAPGDQGLYYVEEGEWRMIPWVIYWPMLVVAMALAFWFGRRRRGR